MFKDWYHMFGKKKEIYSNSATVFFFPLKHLKYQTELGSCSRYYEGQFSQYSKAVRSMEECIKMLYRGTAHLQNI